MVKLYRKLNRYIPTASFIIFIFGLVSLGIYIGLIQSTEFADTFNSTVAYGVRWFTAKVSGIFPFSIAELLLLTSPVILVTLLYVCIRHVSISSRHAVRTIVALLSAIALVMSLFVWSFYAGYRTTSLEDRLGLDRQDVSGRDLYNTITIVIDKLNELDDSLLYIGGSENAKNGSVRPYSHDETVELCTESYRKLSEEYGFFKVIEAPVKQLVVSDIMTYTHISGCYVYLTGESNLNTNYPYYVNVFTTAHEMAHRMGIARENEANFMAYLVCINSDDPYMQYAGYLNMYEYLASPLYTASPTLYAKALRQLDYTVRYDLQCYSEFFDKYRENVAADVSDTVNDTYLKLQGSEDGTKSYGMVVDLAVAYYRSDFPADDAQ